MMSTLERWMARLKARPHSTIEVAGAHPLAPGLAVYVIDVDGQRTVLAAGSHVMCVLSTYRTPPGAQPEGQQPRDV